jgi:hypothetical protein
VFLSKNQGVFSVSQSLVCPQFALTETSENDINIGTVHRRINDIMNQPRHLLSLLSYIIRSIIDGCIPEIGELQSLHTFLEASHSARGNASLFTNRLADWIARLCDTVKGKLTPVPSKLARKRKRTASFVQPLTQSALRYEVILLNSHYHGLNDVLLYDVTWREPGSANTMEPYSSLHHLDVLTEYERRFEASRDSKDYYKALYLCQRNKERDAMQSEEDTDSEMTETEPVSQPL